MLLTENDDFTERKNSCNQINSGRKDWNASMSFLLQFSFLIARYLANIVQPRLFIEGAEEFLFMVTYKRAHLCLMKCNLKPEAAPLSVQLGKHRAQATHFSGELSRSYS